MSDGQTRSASAAASLEGATRSGTMITRMPAAAAAATPGSESSRTTHAAGRASSLRAVARKMSGAGLPQSTSSPAVMTGK